MSWRIDVLDSSGTVLGAGPITSALSWESTARMDRAGVFSFEMPASDAKASLIEPLRIVRCYATVAGAWVEVGAGVVERIETQIGEDGGVTLNVSGADLVGLLALVTVDKQYIDGSYAISEPMTPVSHAQAVAVLAAPTSETPVGLWTFTADSAPAVDSLVGRWNFESVLQAAISLAAKCRTHFYYSGFAALTFAGTATDSGVRAVRAGGDLGSGLAAIARLRVVEDASDVVTVLIPFGGGNADARLTLAARTTATPSGYSVADSASGDFQLVTHTAALAAYGYRYATLAWNEITPISSTDGDVQAAADALFEQALRYLEQHAAPGEFYELALANCPTVLRPMQTVRVVYRDAAQNVDIDADLLILEATTTLTADGPQTTGLLVSTVDRWPESDSGALVQRLTGGQMYQAAPQLNANSYVISYTKPVDDAETATFRFRFDSEVVQLTRLTFDFQLLPLESTVKSVAGTSETTSAGGSSTPTSSSGGSSTPTSAASGDHTHTVTIGTHTHSITLGDHTHSITIGNHTHSITLGNHTHSTPDHSHTFRISGGSTPTYNVGFGAAGTAGGLVHNASGSDFNYPTNSGEGGSTSGSGGGTSTTSGSGGGTSTTSGSGGGTSTTSGSGGSSTPTSASGGSHTHSVTIAAHTHTVTIGTHTHDYTPTITATYGIFRDSAANTFGLTDLEYSVDGSTWYAFSVGVNGFASLGDDWYRVDLTALLQNSTTLRPTANNNAVRVRRKSTGAIKTAMIEAQINVRTIIQAIAAL